MSKRLLAGFLLSLAVASSLCGGPGVALEGDRQDQGKPDDDYDQPTSIAKNLPAPLREPATSRDALAARGFDFGVKYIGEVFSNTSGGLHTGTIYEGKLRFSLDADFDKAFGTQGSDISRQRVAAPRPWHRSLQYGRHHAGEQYRGDADDALIRDVASAKSIG